MNSFCIFLLSVYVTHIRDMFGIALLISSNVKIFSRTTTMMMLVGVEGVVGRRSDNKNDNAP